MTLHFITVITTYSNWPTPYWWHVFPQIEWGWDNNHGSFSGGITVWLWFLWIQVAAGCVYEWTPRLK